MYRGRRAVISWSMTSVLTFAAALGAVAVGHTLQTPPVAAASAAPSSSTVASAPTTGTPTTYTASYSDEGVTHYISGGQSAGTAKTSDH